MDKIVSVINDLTSNIEVFISGIPVMRIVSLLLLIIIVIMIIKVVRGIMSFVLGVVGLFLFLYIVDPAIYSTALMYAKQFVNWIFGFFT